NVGRVLGHGRGSSAAQLLTKLVVGEVTPDRLAERGSVSSRDEQPVDAVVDDFRDAARLHREHGRSDGESLDNGVREVLPARGKDRRVGGTEELDDALARLCSEKRDSLADPE